MALRRPLIVVSLAMAAAFAACTLNPQPLPPRDGDLQATGGADSGASDSGAFANTPPGPPEDAAGGRPDSEGGGTGGDGGDAGDGSADAADADAS